MDFKTLFASVPAAAQLLPEGSEVQSISLQKEAGALDVALALPRLATGKDVAAAENALKEALSLSEVHLDVTMPAQCFSEEYFSTF